MINKKDLKRRIESHLSKDLKSEKYQIQTIKASQLLTHTRFDLAFKLLYLEMRDKNTPFAKEIYKEHIRAFSLGKFTEYGNEEKNSIEKFIEEFDATFKDIQANGFDVHRTLIPLSPNGSIANGAHRVASALYLDKDVTCVQIETADHIYDYNFFYNRNISSEILDIAATQFIKYAQNIYIAFIWPTAQGHDEKIEEVIPNIVYRKNVKLTSNGAHNLLSQIYYGEKWLGSIEDDFKGVKGKLIECFKRFDPVRVIAFQANNLDDVLKIKESVREIFNIGKHSIHITDTKEETIKISRMVFNENSIHFLNYAQPNKYLSTHQKINEFKIFMEKNNLTPQNVLIDSSLVLSIYGIREAQDTDYLSNDASEVKINAKNINSHDEELKYYDDTKQELIFNPKHYFYFNDLKFLSFANLYKMKKKRAEEKDLNDCKMMEGLIDNDYFKQIINKSKQKIYYSKIRIRSQLITILKELKLYNLSKNIYKKLTEN